MTLVQFFVCGACDFRFGPVGVEPYDFSSDRHQVFVFCTACRKPKVAEAVAGKITTPCSHCGATDFAPLDACPRCDDTDVHWRMPGQLEHLSPDTPAANAGLDDEHRAEPPPALAPRAPPAEPPASTPAARPASISIEYRPVPGCLLAGMGLLTLGVANLVIWLAARKWPIAADEDGVVLRNGKRVAWSRIRRVFDVTTDQERTVALKMAFEYDGGTWELPYQRLVAPQEVLDFIMARVPASANPR